jgi:hypothetical protein
MNASARSSGVSPKAADKPFGITNFKSQMAELKSEICYLKFLAQRGLTCRLRSQDLPLAERLLEDYK